MFLISKGTVQYNNIEVEKDVRNLLVAIFTAINSLIVLPYIAKLLDKIHENDIEKTEFSKRIIIIILILAVCMFLECGYMKDTQIGILKIYQSISK